MSQTFVTTDELMKKYGVISHVDIPIEAVNALPYRKGTFHKMLKALMKNEGYVIDKISSTPSSQTFVKRVGTGYYYIRFRNPIKSKWNGYHIECHYSLYALDLMEGIDPNDRYLSDIGIYSLNFDDINPLKEKMPFRSFDLNYFETNQSALDYLNGILFSKNAPLQTFFSESWSQAQESSTTHDFYMLFRDKALAFFSLAKETEVDLTELFESEKAGNKHLFTRQDDVEAFLNFYRAAKLYKKIPFSNVGFTLHQFKFCLIKLLFYFGRDYTFLKNKYNTPFQFSTYSSFIGVFGLSPYQFTYMLYMTFIEKYLQN